ncbi:MAG: methyltransferase domain-containing protein [bacterium]
MSDVEKLQRAILLNAEGEQHFAQGEVEAALELYQKALRVAPDFVTAWNNRGVAEASLRRFPEAVASLAVAASMVPDEPNVSDNSRMLLDLLKLPLPNGEGLQAWGASLNPLPPVLAGDDGSEIRDRLMLLGLAATQSGNGGVEPADSPQHVETEPESEVNLEFLERQKEFWNVTDEREARYGRIVTDGRINRMNHEEQDRVWEDSVEWSINHLFDGLTPRPEWTILDIGCGIGRMVKPLRERFARVDGVDIAETMIEMGNQYLSDASGHGRLLVNSGYDLKPLPANDYDLVYSTIVFQHIRSASVVRNYLRETLRVLKPGGVFRLQVHDTSNPKMGRFDEEADASVQYEFYGNAYEPRQLESLLREAGFVNVSSTHNSPWIWATARKVG